MKRLTTADDFFASLEIGWKQTLLLALMRIILSCGLKEEVKWGIPVYTLKGNVLGVAAFKNHVAVWFYEGAALSDPLGVLVAADSKTQALRQWRFKEGDDMREEDFRRYVIEAMQNMEIGVKVLKPAPKPLILPQELETALLADPLANEMFGKLSLTKKREFVEHIDSAKKPETRSARLQRTMELIRKGVGLNDKYR